MRRSTLVVFLPALLLATLTFAQNANKKPSSGDEGVESARRGHRRGARRQSHPCQGYGYRDVENRLPVTTATLFPIGSITKSFTALTFAILKNKGRVE